MSIDDGPADRQAHPDAARFRRVERLENTFETFRTDARAGIAHRYDDAICPLCSVLIDNSHAPASTTPMAPAEEQIAWNYGGGRGTGIQHSPRSAA
jgi:hypothetical protein